MLTIYTLGGALLALGVYHLVRTLFSRPKDLSLPPGPSPLPLIGNVFDVPQDEAWKVFREWGKKYGDIMYFHTFGKSVVVLNSAEIAHDLLDKRSSIYSCRPYMAMAAEVIGWNWALPIVPYGEKFKRHRRYIQNYLHKQRLPELYDMQLKEVHRLLNDLLDDPDNYLVHFKRMAGGMTLSMTYGHEVESVDDPYLTLAEKGVLTIEATGAVGAHIVDLVPWLRHIPDWLPGAGFKRLPPGTREDLHAFLHVPYEQVKRDWLAGTAAPCYASAMLEETEGKDDEGVRSTAGVMFSGSFDTSMSVLTTAMVAMVLNPIVQARAQAELDLVVGRHRLPTFADRENLPYLQCIISEVFRWGSATPVGVPHRLMEDDEYNGYRIPANSMVIVNAWAMLHDERMYPEPERFNPDRFLSGEGRTPQPDPRGPAFGFGRRVCPGKELAENSLWATLALMLYSFRISRATDENGNEIPVSDEFKENSIRHPKPFKCAIKPRLKNSVALIRQASEAH